MAVSVPARRQLGRPQAVQTRRHAAIAAVLGYTRLTVMWPLTSASAPASVQHRRKDSVSLPESRGATHTSFAATRTATHSSRATRIAARQFRWCSGALSQLSNHRIHDTIVSRHSDIKPKHCGCAATSYSAISAPFLELQLAQLQNRCNFSVAQHGVQYTHIGAAVPSRPRITAQCLRRLCQRSLRQYRCHIDALQDQGASRALRIGARQPLPCLTILAVAAASVKTASQRQHSVSQSPTPRG